LKVLDESSFSSSSGSVEGPPRADVNSPPSLFIDGRASSLSFFFCASFEMEGSFSWPSRDLRSFSRQGVYAEAPPLPSLPFSNCKIRPGVLSQVVRLEVMLFLEAGEKFPLFPLSVIIIEGPPSFRNGRHPHFFLDQSQLFALPLSPFFSRRMIF